ncbi:uncharacterized protein LOC141691147 [Apium graveolens]|uniref:uncharacterized protein LOC141691147 n=1 Tax=Apium graveolens TaxID=4045 RepID=UPI003D78EAEA
MYDITYDTRTTIKSHALADFVAEFSPSLLSGADQELQQLVSKADVEPWTLYTDGASNINGTGLGLVLKSPQGDIMVYSICCEFKATNNESEYEALIVGLTTAIDLKINHICINYDSLLIVNHVKGIYEEKDEKMTVYLRIVKELQHKFTTFNIQQISRELNTQADALAGLGAIFRHESLTNIPIIHILKTIRDREEIEQEIMAVESYYWLSLKEDALNYVKKCDAYQRHAPLIHRPSEQLHPTLPSWPFMKWGIDIVGKMPPTPGQKVYMLAVADYFSKWIEAESFRQVKSKEANGQAESSNEIIINNLKRRLSSYKGKWVEQLPWVLWSDRTTPKTSTGQTPFSLVYGTEAVLPTEVLTPTARYGLATYESNHVEMAHDLDTLDESRDMAKLRLASS